MKLNIKVKAEKICFKMMVETTITVGTIHTMIVTGWQRAMDSVALWVQKQQGSKHNNQDREVIRVDPRAHACSSHNKL